MAKRGTALAGLAEFRDGRDDNNLAEFPLSVLTDTVPEGLKTIEFEDWLDDWQTGKTIQRRVTITGSDQFGLPTPKDEDVLLALIQYTKIVNNFTSSVVYFTKRQIIELLGWQNRGWAYDRLEESLHRWKGVSIHYKSAWRDNALRQWRDSEALGVIEYVKLTDSRFKQGGSLGDGRSQIIWNKVLFDSFASGYLKRLDYQTYRSLQRPAARRAFRFLDKRFFHKPSWDFELRTFACEKIGLSRSYDTGQLKQRLQPALGELERIGFIAPVQYRKQRPKVWQISITKANSDSAESGNEKPACPLSEELVRRGVAASVANKLVASHAEAAIREKIDFFDWLVARRDKRIAKNPPGFLVASIPNYRPSKDFLRAAKQPRKAAKPDTTQPIPLTAQERTLLEHVDKLSAEQKTALEAQAIEAASPIERAIYERHALKGGQLWEELRKSLVVNFLNRNPSELLSGEPQPADK